MTETYSMGYFLSTNKYVVPNDCKQTFTEEEKFMRFRTVGFSIFLNLPDELRILIWCPSQSARKYKRPFKLYFKVVGKKKKKTTTPEQVAKSFVQYHHRWITHHVWLLMATRCPAKEKRQTKNKKSYQPCLNVIL